MLLLVVVDLDFVAVLHVVVLVVAFVDADPYLLTFPDIQLGAERDSRIDLLVTMTMTGMEVLPNDKHADN